MRGARDLNVIDSILLASTAVILTQPYHTRLQWLVFFLAGISLWPERKAVRKVFAAVPALAALLLFAAVSLCWSESPPQTLDRLVGLYGATAVGLLFGVKFDLECFVHRFSVSISIVIILSLLLVFFIPSVGIDSEGDLWRGLYSYKTQLGLGMVLAIITLVCTRWPRVPFGRSLLAANGACCLLLLIKSNSVTAAISLLIIAGLTPTLLLWRAHRLRLWMLISVTAISVVFLVAFSSGDGDFNVFGRDTTLTGRTEIWSHIVDAISDRPILGYGYGAFWDTGPWHEFIAVTDWQAKASHNGYLEVMVNTGAAGGLLLFLFLGTAVLRTGSFFWRGLGLFSAWPLLIIISELITNVSEATFICPQEWSRLDWALIVAATVFTVKDTPSGAGMKFGSTKSSVPRSPANQPAVG
jgi:hypothetical protein